MNLKSAAILFISAISTFPSYAGDFDPEAFITAHNKWRAEAGVTDKLNK